MIVAQGELVPLALHPVLEKYYLTLDISSQGVDHDYDLPNEEFSSPAVHPRTIKDIPSQSLFRHIPALHTASLYKTC